jgi:catechol 2,3-dioxygenase-like lactoylglutathione lyase family enzyme
VTEGLVVEHVDFVSSLTQDISRAKRFYGDVLGLEIETEGSDDMELLGRP